MARRSRNYYELLGVSPDASREEIHSAYRRLARRYHPDLNAGGDAGDRFNELSGAYEVLHDPVQRARYDRSRAVKSRTAAGRYDRSRGVGSAPLAGRYERPANFGRSRTAARVPVFSAQRPRRDVPRFLDSEPGGVGLRLGVPGFGPRGGVRVQLVVRWLR
jgi:DnaJ-class molecular chaperone